MSRLMQGSTSSFSLPCTTLCSCSFVQMAVAMQVICWVTQFVGHGVFEVSFTTIACHLIRAVQLGTCGSHSLLPSPHET